MRRSQHVSLWFSISEAWRRQGLNLILRDLLFAIALYQLQLTCGDQFRHLSFPGRILIYRDSSIVRKGILKTLGQLTN